jgi:Secretion system C-terminal sorting domain/Thrombospondin type 3 repeat
MRSLKILSIVAISFIAMSGFSQSLLDSDNDGITDITDNCALTWNPSQSDLDGDLIGDACDCEPNSANPLGAQIPAILINTSSNDTISPGTVVTFTTLISSGGTAPIYKWYKNTSIVGTNSPSYVDSTLVTGDTVFCTLSSNIICAASNLGISNQLTFSVIVSSSLNGYFNTDKLIAIMPNPVKSTFSININERIEFLELLDINGKLLRQWYDTKPVSFDINEIQNGLYVLRIQTDKHIYFEKIIRE